MKLTLHSTRKLRGPDGSALIAVFWLIAVLGMVGFGAAKMLEGDTRLARVTRERAFAKRQAEMGLAIGQHPAVRAGDPLLRHTDDTGASHEVRLTTEESRCNINVLVQSPDRTLLRRILLAWGLEPEEAAALQDALTDWVDDDENVSLNGAERQQYEQAGRSGAPFNRPFRSLDEVALVRGMDRVSVVAPQWRNWLTVLSEGKLDVNEVAPDLLAAMTGMAEDRFQALVDFRNGMDKQSGTADDRRFTSVEEALPLLGINTPQGGASLAEWFTVEARTRRIESCGTFGSQRRCLVLVVRDGMLLSREEERNDG